VKRLLLLIPLISFLFIDINIPFVGPYGNNNSTYSLQAKNYVRFGYLKTNFAPFKNFGNNFPETPQYYLNHPPLLQILLSFSYKIFGQDNNWAGRLVPIVSTIMSIFILSKIIEIFFGSNRSKLSILIASTLPMTIVYGKLLQFEPVLLPFILLSLFLFIKYVKGKSGKILLLLILTVIIGFLADWPVLSLAVLLGFLFLIHESRKKQGIVFFFIMTGVSLLLFIGYFTYTSSLTGEASTLSQAYLNRSFNGPPFHLPNSGLYFLKVMFLRFVVYFTPLGLLFSVLFLRKLVSDIKKSKLENKVFLLLFIFPLIYVLAFPNGAWEHPYWLFYFIPFVAISFTYYVSELFAKLKGWKKNILIFFLSLNLIFSFSIFQMKRVQTNKALWQGSFVNKIVKFINSDKEIGINWDFNDDFLRYKLDRDVYILWEKDHLMEYLSKNPRSWDHFVFACWANCSDQDKRYFLSIENKYKVLWRDENALFIDLHQFSSSSSAAAQESTQIPSRWPQGLLEGGTLMKDESSKKNILNQFIKLYRKLRDSLALEQI